MRYAIDTEFIDTPSCSALISLAIVREDMVASYFEFSCPSEELTPWLKENVVIHLRLFGGFMKLPENWPKLYNELAATGNYVPTLFGAPHDALNDAKSLMLQVLNKRLRPQVR